VFWTFVFMGQSHEIPVWKVVNCRLRPHRSKTLNNFLWGLWIVEPHCREPQFFRWFSNGFCKRRQHFFSVSSVILQLVVSSGSWFYRTQVQLFCDGMKPIKNSQTYKQWHWRSCMWQPHRMVSDSSVIRVMLVTNIKVTCRGGTKGRCSVFFLQSLWKEYYQLLLSEQIAILFVLLNVYNYIDVRYTFSPIITRNLYCAYPWACSVPITRIHRPLWTVPKSILLWLICTTPIQPCLSISNFMTI